ncbi:hypothetical protein [Bradyrhizobium sp. Ai1a-2]|uniref:hypothetical protein n=1 Tax=Bradyrhizobium sp. Ai1a-2 TaxID=196490 RepID=UPI0006853FF1|nr:hypothetical protein [Bradyrhizobium sp. Ai1a-2]
MAELAVCPFQTDRFRDAYGERKTLDLMGVSRVFEYATGKPFSKASSRMVSCVGQPSQARRCPWHSGSHEHLHVELSHDRALPLAIAEVKELLNGAPLQVLFNNVGISLKATGLRGGE